MLTCNYIFPTAIGIEELPELAEKYYPIFIEYLNKYGENFLTDDSHFSTYRSNEAIIAMHNDPVMKELTDTLIEKSILYLKAQNVDGEFYRKSLTEDNMYLVNRIQRGGWHEPHTHRNSLISGCLYLNVSEDSSPIRFFDPRGYAEVVHYPVAEYFPDSPRCLYPHVTFPVKTGLLLLFPGWLRHMVIRNESDNERLTVAFNMGTYGG